MGCHPTVFTIDNANIPALDDGDAAEFLGKPVGFSLVSEPNDVDALASAREKILGSFLAPWQRIDALKSFFFPSLHYAQRTFQVNKFKWKDVDDRLRPLIKDSKPPLLGF